jgi:glycosyltransferase involved in cell wall biosynthesis
MRIGMITGEYPPMQGGVGAYTALLAREFAATGHGVHVLTTPPAVSGSRDGVTVDARMRGWGVGALSAVRTWVRDVQPDLMVMQFQTAAYRMSPFVHFLPDALRGVPFVTVFHDLRHPYLFPKAGRLRDAIVMRLARASSGVVVTNHEDAARIAHLPRTCLIPIGSNILAHVDDASAWRAHAGADQDTALIGYFGLINQSKGVDTLLGALRRLLDSGVRARLLLIGAVAGHSDPSNITYARQMEARIADLHLSDHIARTGYVGEQDAAGYLAACDVIALPFADGASYRRGSLMAAIRLGCPIVTTHPVVPVPTFVHGETMYLVPPGAEGALAEGLRAVLDDARLRDRLRRGAAGLAGEFEWSAIARSMLAFFDQVREAA